MVRSHLVASLVLFAVVLSACGNEPDGAPEGRREAVQASEGAQPGTTQASGGQRRLKRTVLPDGTEVIVQPGGATIYRAPKPTQTRTSPSEGCTPAEDLGRVVPGLFNPPRPGISARSGPSGTVVVAYRFRSLPTRCKPVQLLISVDVHDDLNPGFSQPFPVRGRTGEISVEVPDVLEAADVVRVSAVSRVRPGSTATTESDTAVVRVRASGS